MGGAQSACAVARGLGKVGDAWSMLVLRDVARGIARFDQLRISLGIAPNILSQRLRSLVDAGILERRRYMERPPRDEYVLTDAGRDFLPVLYAIAEWGRRHHGEGGVTRLRSASGNLVEPAVIDRLTGQELAGQILELVDPDDA